jgi:hypothetical protein
LVVVPRILSSLKLHRKWFLALVVVLVAGAAAGAGAIISNIFEYPGSVITPTGRLTLVGVGGFPANGTTVEWTVGVRMNVTPVVTTQGYVGLAHPVWEIQASGVTCNDVQITPYYPNQDSASCAAATDLVSFTGNSRSIAGGSTTIWYFFMTFNKAFSSIVFRVYIVTG